MVFKFRYKQLGGHIHISMFVAKQENMTFAKSGDLVLSAGREWDEFRHIVLDGGDTTHPGQGIKPGVIVEAVQ